MKFETLFLRGLFGACTLICGLILAAMITTKPASAPMTANHSIAATVAPIAHVRTAG